MSHELGSRVSFNIDDSKVMVVTRAQRLKGVTLKVLEVYLALPIDQRPDIGVDVNHVSEAQAWLSSMEV